MKIKELLSPEKGNKYFMLGNEAAVRGVLECGLSLAATYPGTPSSEIGDILYKIAKSANVYFEFKVIYWFTRSVESSTDNEETTQYLILKNVQSIGSGLPYLNNLAWHLVSKC